MRDITALHPRLQEKAAKLKTCSKNKGILIEYSECLRTIAEQEVLYAQGRTAPGNIITNARGRDYGSQHQWGIAVDFYLDMDVNGNGEKKDDAFNNATGLFEQVGQLAESIGLGWGGRWTSFKDRPHLYLPDWGSTVKKLKTEYGTPETFMASWSNSKVSIENINSANEYERTQFIIDVQLATGSNADGKAGTETIRNTVTISRTINKNHAVVTPLERQLKSLGFYKGIIEEEEGKIPNFGPKMKVAVNAYQKEILKYTKLDGEITAGKKMWKSLLGMC